MVLLMTGMMMVLLMKAMMMVLLMTVMMPTTAIDNNYDSMLADWYVSTSLH